MNSFIPVIILYFCTTFAFQIQELENFPIPILLSVYEFLPNLVILETIEKFETYFKIKTEKQFPIIPKKFRFFVQTHLQKRTYGNLHIDEYFTLEEEKSKLPYYMITNIISIQANKSAFTVVLFQNGNCRLEFDSHYFELKFESENFTPNWKIGVKAIEIYWYVRDDILCTGINIFGETGYLNIEFSPGKDQNQMMTKVKATYFLGKRTFYAVSKSEPIRTFYKVDDKIYMNVPIFSKNIFQKFRQYLITGVIDVTQTEDRKSHYIVPKNGNGKQEIHEFIENYTDQNDYFKSYKVKYNLNVDVELYTIFF